jgi:hypothetical protein
MFAALDTFDLSHGTKQRLDAARDSEETTGRQLLGFLSGTRTKGRFAQRLASAESLDAPAYVQRALDHLAG